MAEKETIMLGKKADTKDIPDQTETTVFSSAVVDIKLWSPDSCPHPHVNSPP